MIETRHWVEVAGRQVFYRRFGTGPAVLALHGSPQSSRAIAPAAQAIAAQGLCVIAPDTPGAGGSTPLAGEDLTSADYARALAGFADALGLGRVGLYGFHTGAATACVFAALYPQRTTGLVLEGLPAWTADEQSDFLANYLPRFLPQWDGSHMTWLWARMEEQVLFFPWHRQGAHSRMAYDVTPPEGVHANCMDLLAAGDAYRAVYRAAFDFVASDWIDQVKAPMLIAMAGFDVLAGHLERPGLQGRGGEAFATLPLLHARAAEHLSAHCGDRVGALPEARDRGFLTLTGGETLAWSGDAGGQGHLYLHAAGGSGRDRRGGGLALDLPGHGGSAQGWTSVPQTLEGWTDVVVEACQILGLEDFSVEGDGIGGQIACALRDRGLAREAGARPPRGGHWPSLTPQWDGAHLVRAFRMARWQQLYAPWDQRTRENALVPYGDLDPAAINAHAIDLLLAHERGAAAGMIESG